MVLLSSSRGGELINPKGLDGLDVSITHPSIAEGCYRLPGSTGRHALRLPSWSAWLLLFSSSRSSELINRMLDGLGASIAHASTGCQDQSGWPSSTILVGMECCMWKYG